MHTEFFHMTQIAFFSLSALTVAIIWKQNKEASHG